MKTKEEILNDSPVWLTFHQRKYVVEAMQEYADQKVKSDRDKRIVEMGAATEAWINELKKQLTAKDNEISRLNGIITEQARLSELVSGDLQKAQKEIQELREGGKALILELNDEVIRLRAEVERLNLIVKQLTNPVSIGTYDGAPKPSITTTSDGVDLVRWVAVELDRPLKIADAEQLLKEYDEAKASPPSSSLFPDRNPSNIPR